MTYTSRVVKEIQDRARRNFEESSLIEKQVNSCTKLAHEMRLNYDNRYRQFFLGEDIPDEGEISNFRKS